MKKYERILAAVDFSDLCLHITQRAAELAEFYGAQLLLLNVIENFPDHLPHYRMSEVDMDPEEFILDRAGKDLDQLRKKIDFAEVETHVRLSRRSAKGEILEFAEENGVDLVVLGVHGRHPVANMLAGSTATGVVRAARFDVLTLLGKE